MRDWSDLFIGVDAQVPVTAGDAGAENDGGSGWFRKLRDNLSRSRRAMTQQVVSVATFDPDSADMWEQIEVGLVTADVGVTTTVAVVEQLEARAATGGLTTGADLARGLREISSELLEVGADTIDVTHAPTVVLMVGVNGTGKTTTIGKLAHQLVRHGKRVTIAAADTFRAAAAEQLTVWAERAGAHIVAKAQGSDPAAVAFDAVQHALDGNADVVLIDTAGRLHTKVDLMQELTKIRRVIERQLPGAPHETLLSIDATTGQNGMQQAREFSSAVDVTGVVLTKLDGSAKGGIALAIANELKIPIKLVGLGEGIDDLRPFDGDDFAAALFPDDLLAAGA